MALKGQEMWKLPPEEPEAKVVDDVGQFQEDVSRAEGSPTLLCPARSPDFSLIKHMWDNKIQLLIRYLELLERMVRRKSWKMYDSFRKTLNVKTRRVSNISVSNKITRFIIYFLHKF